MYKCGMRNAECGIEIVRLKCVSEAKTNSNSLEKVLGMTK